MKPLGKHRNTEVLTTKDCNGRHMVRCLDCGIYAHATEIPTAESHLIMTACAPECKNCNNLRRSYDGRPAVPIRGSCNTILHVCPYDGNKWWQANDHFHLWQRVTDPEEWEILLREKNEKMLRAGIPMALL
jgi:hypothetical protein